MRNAAATILLLLSIALLLTGCSSGRHCVPGMQARPVKADIALLPSAGRDVACLSCPVRMTASINGEEASLKGRLRVKGGEGVQVSATAMGLMEAACIEFLPQAVRFLYKIDKVYAESPYASVPFLGGTGTGYSILEHVLLNRMFSPDGAPFAKALSGMHIADEGDTITVTTKGGYPVVYRFSIEKESGNLVKSEGWYASGGNVVCRYSGFKELGGLPFPQRVEVSFSGGGSSAELTLRLGNLSGKEFKLSPRRVSKAFRRVSLEAIIESMGSME